MYGSLVLVRITQLLVGYARHLQAPTKQSKQLLISSCAPLYLLLTDMAETPFLPVVSELLTSKSLPVDNVINEVHISFNR